MRNALGNKVRSKAFTRELDRDLEDLRDDCIALFINSGLRQKDITAAGGPTPGTISKWLYKETFFPRYQTIASFTRALGCRLAVVDKDAKIGTESKPDVLVRAPGQHKPKMPPRKLRGSKRQGLKLVAGTQA